MLVALALLLASPTSALRPNTTLDPCKGRSISTSAFARWSADVWRPIYWERGAPKKATIQAQRLKLQCARGAGHRKAMRHRWRKDKRVYYRHRHAVRERLRYLPFDCGSTRSAIPCSVMLCESGGSYTARNPSSTAGGRYQIIDSTWADYGGKPYADSHPAAVAPPAEQDRIAAAIWRDAGPTAWVCA